MKKKKFNVGGNIDNNNQQLGNNIGSIAGQSLNLLVPGLGAIAAPILSQLGSQIGAKQDMTKALQDHFNSMSNSTNPYGNYKNGGEISGYEGLLTYNGDSHEAPSGGIDVTSTGLPTPSSNQQVEGGETVRRVGKKAYVFSDTLKL